MSDDGLETARAIGDRFLTLVTHADTAQRVDEVEFFLALKIVSDGLQFAHGLIKKIVNMPFVAVDVFDEDGIHSISRRAPLVFREEPRRCPRQFFAAVQDA